MVKKKIIIFVVFILTTLSVNAATFYVCDSSSACGFSWNNGDNLNDCLSKMAPCKTIQEGIRRMSNSDILIVGNGTYLGEDNMIITHGDHTVDIPQGNLTDYTIIKAEFAAGVIIDGEGINIPVYLSGNESGLSLEEVTGTSHNFIEINGIVAKNGQQGSFMVYNCNHIRIINVGAFDAADGNTGPLMVGACSDILIEGAYVWGNGRYDIFTGATKNMVIRNSVVRHDRSNSENDPIGGIINYGNANVEVQNCIVIDSDQSQFFLDYTEDQGVFGNPGTSARSDNGSVKFRNCISLNNHLKFGSSDWGMYRNNITYDNCVGWDQVATDSLLSARGDSYIKSSTFGEITTKIPSNSSGFFWGYNAGGLYANRNEMTSSIVYNAQGRNIFLQWEKSNNNNVYGLSNGTYIDKPGGDTSESTNVSYEDPIENGLKYIIRTEQDSNLSNKSIGANIMYQIGKSGTMWGEEGYNLTQDGTNGQDNISLWPFPNEDVIKEYMQLYYYTNGTDEIRGDRGFAANGTGLYGSPITLTSYIWEYLGNPCPEDICNYDVPKTYYMANESCSDANPGTESEPVCDLKTAFSLMKGGDTLIIKDGTYTGENNRIIDGQVPPVGSNNKYTEIRARNPGKVIFDGQGILSNLVLTDNSPINYTKFYDLIWGRSADGITVHFGNEDHLILDTCGVYDSSISDSISNSALYISHGTNILIENCFVWGESGYGIAIRDSQYAILRRNVIRKDKTQGVRSSGITVYSTKDALLQNNILIDGDQDNFYINVTGYGYGFFFVDTNGPNERIKLDGNIILNFKFMSALNEENNINLSVNNQIVWQTNQGWYDRTNTQGNYKNCIFGTTYDPTWNNLMRPSSVYDSLFINAARSGVSNLGIGNYNLYYNNTYSNFGTTANENINDYCLENGNEINPFTNSLKYLPRIEDSSDLSGKASDGGDLGATILYKVGRDGTLWGEEGYNETTNESLWPFPNEDIIKEHFSSYYYTNGTDEIRGDRGFAANGTGLYGGPITLTSYIWEYLGNPCPEEICNYTVPHTYHKADLDYSGVIEDSETKSFWQRWRSNLESFSDMFDVLRVWKSG